METNWIAQKPNQQTDNTSQLFSVGLHVEQQKLNFSTYVQEFDWQLLPKEETNAPWKNCWYIRT
jgi:hypothetical protein